MRYEWDPVKDAENRRKHGYSLEDGVPVLEDPESIAWYDERFDYGEERILNLGRSGDSILLVVSTFRAENLIRLISVRRAAKHEEYWFLNRRP